MVLPATPKPLLTSVRFLTAGLIETPVVPFWAVRSFPVTPFRSSVSPRSVTSSMRRSRPWSKLVPRPRSSAPAGGPQRNPDRTDGEDGDGYRTMEEGLDRAGQVDAVFLDADSGWRLGRRRGGGMVQSWRSP